MKQQGNVFVIVLVLIVLVVGAWQYSEFQARKRVAAAQMAEAEKDRAERARQDAERAELERRQAKAKEELDSMKLALKAVDDLAIKWRDATQVAGATSRIALSGPVSTLQALKREAQALTVPPCLDQGIAALRKSMDLTLEGYIVFMTEKGEFGKLRAGSLLNQGADEFKAFSDGRSSCPA